MRPLIRLKFEKRLHRRRIGELIDPGKQSTADCHETAPHNHSAALLEAERRRERATQVAVERHAVPQAQRHLVVVYVVVVQQKSTEVAPSKPSEVGGAGMSEPSLVAPTPRAVYYQTDEVSHSTLTRLAHAHLTSAQFSQSIAGTTA